MNPPKPKNVFVTSEEAIIDVREVAGACLDPKAEDGGRLTVMLKRGTAMHMDGKNAAKLFAELRKRCEDFGSQPGFALDAPAATKRAQ